MGAINSTSTLREIQTVSLVGVCLSLLSLGILILVNGTQLFDSLDLRCSEAVEPVGEIEFREVYWPKAFVGVMYLL